MITLFRLICLIYLFKSDLLILIFLSLKLSVQNSRKHHGTSQPLISSDNRIGNIQCRDRSECTIIFTLKFVLTGTMFDSNKILWYWWIICIIECLNNLNLKHGPSVFFCTPFILFHLCLLFCFTCVTVRQTVSECVSQVTLLVLKLTTFTVGMQEKTDSN